MFFIIGLREIQEVGRPDEGVEAMISAWSPPTPDHFDSRLPLPMGFLIGFSSGPGSDSDGFSMGPCSVHGI